MNDHIKFFLVAFSFLCLPFCFAEEKTCITCHGTTSLYDRTANYILVYPTSYIKAKSIYADHGWTLKISDYKNFRRENLVPPEVDCGSGRNAVCSVTFCRVEDEVVKEISFIVDYIDGILYVVGLNDA